MQLDPKDIVEHLRHNLERYPYGDGFPVLRELLQNADDARAGAVAVHLLEGWPEAENQLLQGPGLLLVNDGEFNDDSVKGMQTFGGSVKALDEAAVGRFGLGQKSAFHLCDAFVVVPEGYGAHAPFVVNPFETLGRPGDACLLWSTVKDADAARIRAAGAASLPGRRRLNLWFPLRRPGLRPKPKSNGIVADDIVQASLASLANRRKVAELLAALRHVQRVSVVMGAAKADLDRGHAPRLVGYTLEPSERCFGGPLGTGLASLGREWRAADDFRRDLRQSAHWPRTRNRETDEEQEQTATPHGAVIAVNDAEATAEVSGDWAVVLPVAAAFSRIPHEGKGRLRLILHGCFFVDSGRKAVIGLDEAGTRPGDDAPVNEANVRAAWNRSLRDRLVLPLIPAVLHDTLTEKVLSGEALAAVVTTLAGSNFGRAHREAICAEQVLARVAETSAGAVVARWRILPSNAQLRPLPAPDERSRVGLAAILPRLADWAKARGLTLVCGPEAVLAPEPPAWEGDELAELLEGLDGTVFQAEARAGALTGFLAVACTDPSLHAAAAGPVLNCLRQALASERTLAPHEAIKAVLAAVDCAGVVPLPPTASARFVLRALAQAPKAVFSLPRDWLPLGTSADLTLDPHEARRLLAALQPLLASDTQADAAAAAALTIVSRLDRMDEALADPALAHLKVLRALSGAGRSLLSLAELDTAAREQRLFKDTPAARRRLNLLAAALPEVQAFILPDAVLKSLEDPDAGRSARFKAVDLDSAAAGALVREATGFGPPDARAELLAEIFTTDMECRGALRALAAGDPRALHDNVGLIVPREAATALDRFLARLLAQSAQEIPVPGVIIDRLDRARKRHLGIAELAGQELGELIRRHADELSDHGLDGEVAAAILTAGIPEEALLRLPVLPRASGGWASAEALFRATPDWAVPTELKALVPMLGDLGDAESLRTAEALVRPWSAEAQIALCLEQPEPARFAAEILAALKRAREPDVDRLRSTPWIRDHRVRPWKPEDVLDLTDDLLAAARRTLGDDLPFLPVGEVAAELRDRPGFTQLRVRRILPAAATSLEALLLIVEDRRPVAYMGEPTAELAEALAELAKSGADLPLPGWPLLAAALRVGGFTSPYDALKAFGEGTSEMPEAIALAMNALADLAEQGKKSALQAYRAAFARLATFPDAAFRRIAQSIRVPVRTRKWKRASQVAFDTEGIADEHLLDDDLARMLRKPQGPGEDAAPEASIEASSSPSERPIEKAPALEGLFNLLDRLSAHFPDEVLFLFAGLIQRSKDSLTGLDRHFGADREKILGFWRRIDEEVRVTDSPDSGKWFRARQELTRLEVDLSVSSAVRVISLSGDPFEASVAQQGAFGVIGNSHRREFRGPYLNQGEVMPFNGRMTLALSGALVRVEELKAVAGRLLHDTFGLPRAHSEALLRLFDEFDQREQKSTELVILAIEDRLPQLLAELKPRQDSLLHRLQRDYRRNEANAEGDRATALAKAKRELRKRLAEPGAQAELLASIRDAMLRHGYRASSVLFELAQNADDAFLQDPLGTAGQLRIQNSADRLTVIHWGRLINSLGPDPAHGREQGWDDDLLNMLIMNLSEKREEATGRFGLGFKSVHLIAREVSIASSFESCRVKGGMLPEVWKEGRDRSYAEARGGRRATIFELEIDPEREEEAQTAREAFTRSVRWLPATARAIREIELDGCRHAARFIESGAKGIRHVALEGVASGHALALELDADTTLFVPLGPDGPEPLSDGIPRLWLLAPLEEECRAGWLLNSYAFRVDPGRGRLAGTHEERAALFDRLGRALGERLVALHDLIEADWPGFARAAGLVDLQPSGAALFRRRLVDLLAADVPRDAADERLETYLHRKGGLRHLFEARPAVPTGLPAPFAPFLKADRLRWQIAGPLADPGRLALLRGWSSLAQIADAAVSAKTAALLERLGFKLPQSFGAAELVRAELRATGGQTDPETAARLGAFLDDDFLDELLWSEQQELAKAAADACFRMADGAWRKARLVPRTAEDADEEERREERRILAFAPDAAVADAAYTDAALKFYRLAARQGGFQQRADTFARWAHDMADAERQRALLAYVLEGRQGGALGQALARERPHWLPVTEDALRESALLDGFDNAARGRLMTTLYLNFAGGIGSGLLRYDMPQGAEPYEEEADPGAELARIRDWWRREHAELRADYDGRIWPDSFRPGQLRDREAADEPVGWFTFLALGIFRTLSWNNEGAHRSFVEAAMRRGWWEEMATARLPADPQPWLDRLEDFARADALRIDFPQWRRTMADLYALARWLSDYGEAFHLLPDVVARDGRLALSDAWRLSASPVWQRRGLEGAPLAQSLGLGANWMIREAIRHSLWTGEDAARMYPYAWAATARVRRLCAERLGKPLGERGSMDMSPDIHRFVGDHLGPDAAFLGDLDLPLQLWNGGGAFFDSDAEEDDA